MSEHSDAREKPVLLNTKEAANYIKSTEGTMRVWKSLGRHSDILQPIRTRQGIRYNLSNLDAFVNLPYSGKCN